MNPDYPVLPIQITGLREDDLPGEMTLLELRRVRRFVAVPE
jgi:hypothetical protein